MLIQNQFKALNVNVETTVVYTEVPITMPMLGICQILRHNARCLPIVSDIVNTDCPL